MSKFREALVSSLFGKAHFADGEEYRRFQYRFTCTILLFSAVITALFHLTVMAGVNQFDPTYMLVSRSYLALSVLYFLLLRRRPQSLSFVAWTYAVASWLLQVATLTLNTVDELRIIWFTLNLAGIYLVLGSRAGACVTALTVVFLAGINSHLPVPYSDNAMFTIILATLYLSFFFHAFAARSISFHHAMVEANHKLADMASKDPLTGLFNARAYYALSDAALRQAERSGAPFSMLFVDLDHFKKVNDTYGHEAGDAVLRAASQTLRESLRQSDLIGRIGGEEFSALLPATDIEGAQVLAEKLRHEIEYLMPDIGGGQCIAITASIGVAGGTAKGQTVAEVQKQADEAMYAAKRAGRNRVTCFKVTA